MLFIDNMHACTLTCDSSPQSVLQSVTHNGRQLFFTLTFTACVVYIYTLVAFNFYQSFYVEDESKR